MKIVLSKISKLSVLLIVVASIVMFLHGYSFCAENPAVTPEQVEYLASWQHGT